MPALRPVLFPALRPVHGVLAAVALAGHAALLLALGPAPFAQAGHQGAPGRVMQVRLHSMAAPSAMEELSTAMRAAVAQVSPEPEPVPLPAQVPTPPVAPAATPAALLEIAAVAPTIYHAASELSEKPQLVHDVAPDLSTLNPPEGAQQSAVLHLKISEAGDIDQVEVARSQMSEGVLQEVLKAYANLKFSPGKIADHAVKSRMTIEVRFESGPAAGSNAN